MSDAAPTDRPALLGGAPVRPEGPPAWPLPDPDVQAIIESLARSGAWGRYHGDHVCAFESELATFHHVPHALTCASGTLAVEVALRALRVGPGDEVVMAAYEYEATFLTVHALGAKPVLIDVRADNWQLDETRLEAAFSPLTKAVICSHLHGGLVDMPAVREITRRRGVGVVEDAAQAPGAVLFGRPAGTWGDVGTLSFGGSKLLTAGRGGAVLCADQQLAQRAKALLHRGVQQWAPLSELQAAVLRPQLAKLRAATEWRAARVRELVSELPWLVPLGCRGPTPPAPPSWQGGGEISTSEPDCAAERGSSFSPPPCREGGPGGGGPRHAPDERLGAGGTAFPHLPAFYKLGFQYDPAAFGLPRALLVKALRAEGIAFDPGFNALHIGRSPSRFRAAGDLTHAAAAHARCVMLHHPVLSLGSADVRQVADAVAKVYRDRDQLTRPG